MDVQYALWTISAGSQCLAFVALCARRLIRPYAFFSAYLACAAGSSLLLAAIGRVDAPSYAVAWVIAEPILLILLVGSVRELVRRFPERYPDFGSFGRAKLRRLLEIAVLIALISSLVEARERRWTYSLVTLIPIVIALKRIVTTVIAGYLMLLTLFTVRFPAPLERNLNIHMRLLTAYSSLASAIMLWQNTAAGGHGTGLSNIILLCGSSVLYGFWICLLTRIGEIPPSRPIAGDDEILDNALREKALRGIAARYSGRRLR